MKNCISLATVCFLMLFASATSLAQEASASPTPQDVIWDPPCPTISVSCPSDIEAGKPLEFKATIGNLDPKLAPTYTWEVVGGAITEGQGTTAIKVKLAGNPGQAVTATLSVGGLDLACSKTASCTNSNCQMPPVSKRFDLLRLVPIDELKSRLYLFAAALKQDPGAQGFIVGYDGRKSRAGKAQKAVDLAKEYLVNKLGLHESRIVSMDGGFKEESSVDLWLVQMGALPPVVAPTVDPTEVKSMKAAANKSAKRPIEH